MKDDSTEQETSAAQSEGNLSKGSGQHERNLTGFARQLRALGQALEKFSFSTFDLELRSGNYLVTGRATSKDNVNFSFPRFVRELLRGSTARPTVRCTENRVDLSFSPDEIEKFDLRGKVKRQDANKMPDPYSVSQILRGAGSYLDNRNVMALVGISLSGKWVTVRYETPEGRLEQAKQDLEYFYDYWVKMYLRRSNRAKLPPASDPTLLVTWEAMHRAHVISKLGG
jgi:hypothetical protein